MALPISPIVIPIKNDGLQAERFNHRSNDEERYRMKRRILITLYAVTAIITSCSTTPDASDTRMPNLPDRSRGYDDNASVNRPFSGCANCGVVVSIDIVPADRTASSDSHTVLEGIVGSVAQQSSGSTSSARATSLGPNPSSMAEGAYQSESYDIKLKMDDGRTLVINQRDLQGIRENMPIRVDHGRVVPR